MLQTYLIVIVLLVVLSSVITFFRFAGRLRANQARSTTTQRKRAVGFGSAAVFVLVIGRRVLVLLYLLFGMAAVLTAIVLAVLVGIGLAAYSLIVRKRAFAPASTVQPMNLAMATAGAGAAPALVGSLAAGPASGGGSVWRPAAPSMPALVQSEGLVDSAPTQTAAPAWPAQVARPEAPQPQPEWQQQATPQPQPEWQQQPEAQPAPAPTVPTKSKTPAPPKVHTAGGRIQVICPACGAGNTVSNRSCILCGKKLPAVT